MLRPDEMFQHHTVLIWNIYKLLEDFSFNEQNRKLVLAVSEFLFIITMSSLCLHLVQYKDYDIICLQIPDFNRFI